MPRPKLVYVGDGIWQPVVATLRECPHLRDRLRFDSRQALPFYLYCTACGKPWLKPWQGLSIPAAAAKREKLRALVGKGVAT